MKLNRLLILGLLLASAGIFSRPGFGSPARDEDFGAWNQSDVEGRWREHWKWRLGEDLRFREHAGLYYYETHAGLQYQFSEWLAAGGEYLEVRQTRTLKGKDFWYWEERPRVYATLSQKMKGWSFDDRNMLEFRFKQNAEDTLRYRNQASVTAPWKWTRFELQPYASDEIFIETSRNGLVENRLYGGFKLRLWRQWRGSIFYLRQSQKNNAGSWKDLDILGTSLKLAL